MGILDNFNKGIGILGNEAKKSYDANRLERRIKSYRKEETELYAKLGKIVYQSRPAEPEYEEIFDNLDAVRARMKHLDKQVMDIRAKPEQERYLKLDRKESDLIVARTDEGIRLVRQPQAASRSAEENS